MLITAEHIRLFRLAYSSDFNESISDADAETMIREFLYLMEILSKPLPDEESVTPGS